MLFVFNLLSERIRITVHERQNRIIALLIVNLQIMTSHTVATVTSLVESETITVQLKTLCLLAIANYLFARWGLLCRRVVVYADARLRHSLRLPLFILTWILLAIFFFRMFGVFSIIYIRARIWAILAFINLLDGWTVKLARISSTVLSWRLKNNPTLNGILPSLIVIDLSVLLWKRSFHNY